MDKKGGNRNFVCHHFAGHGKQPWLVFRASLENCKKADQPWGEMDRKKTVCCRGRLLEVIRAKQIEQKNIEGLQINQIVDRKIYHLQEQKINVVDSYFMNKLPGC